MQSQSSLADTELELLLPPPPIILVTDCTQQPQITLHYINGNNEIDFEEVYKTIRKSLRKFKPCTHRPSPDSWPCRVCTNAFNKIFWWSAARICDYIADFLAHDTRMMGSIWFQLLDDLQESQMWLPYKAILDNPPEATEQTVADFFSNNEFSTVLGHRHAAWFEGNYLQTIALMKELLRLRKNRRYIRGDVIHPPDGEVMGPTGEYNTGPWQSGLTPWQQFLCAGSPGVDGFEDIEKEAAGGSVRYLPMAAIGIIKTHTERARKAARNISSDPEFLERFEKKCLVFPQSVNDPPCSFHSTDGKEMMYKLVNGAPPIVRSGGYPDEDMLFPNETFTMLDDGAGLLRGIKAYKPVSGEPHDEEDDEDDNDGYRDDAFDMWAVYERKEMPGGTESNKMAED